MHISAFVLLSVSASFLALKADNPALVLRPAAFFDLRNSSNGIGPGSLSARDFVVVGGELRILVAYPRQPATPQVVVTDLQGAVRKAVRLPADSEYLSVAAPVTAAEGLVWAGRTRLRQGELALIGPGGEVIRTQPTTGPPLAILGLAGSPAWASPRQISLPVNAALPLAPSPTLILAKVANSIIAVDQVTGEGIAIDLISGSTGQFALSGDAVDSHRNLNARHRQGYSEQATSRLLLVNSIEGAASGFAYVLLAPVSQTNGATVVKLSQDGRVTSVYQCLPPAGEGVAWNPHRIRATSDGFVLLTMNGLVAAYSKGDGN